MEWNGMELEGLERVLFVCTNSGVAVVYRLLLFIAVMHFFSLQVQVSHQGGGVPAVPQLP